MGIIGEKITTDFNPVASLGELLKIPLILFLVLILLYSFLLSLRVKILVDTVQADGNSKMKVLSYLNLLISIVITIMGTIIIVFV